MPELPDVTLYVEHLARRIVGARFLRARVASPNLLRTADPTLASASEHAVRAVSRVGKRIVIELEGEIYLVFHLMIAGRFHWKPPEAAELRKESAATGRRAKRADESGVPDPGARARTGAMRAGLGRNGLAAFEFSTGTLTLTEASTQQRASLHVVRGRAAVRALDAGGIEPLTATFEAFRTALKRENHTLKHALTDPRLFSGIGNAYSDEILHRAQLSPLQLTHKIDDAAIARLQHATRSVLEEWTERLRVFYGERFPEKVTAFRAGMAVHGRFREPCPRCGAPVQRIVYASNETNYCARCQTGGRLLADRALSKLLHDDWPRRLEELEE